MADTVTAILGLGRSVGIGLARRFSDADHHVLICDSSQRRVDAAREQLPDSVGVLQSPIDTEIGIRNALSATIEAYDRIDNLIVIPAIPEADTLLGLETPVIEKRISLAINAAVLSMKLCAERMQEFESIPGTSTERTRQKGAIVFVLSTTALSASPGQFSESITQSAILAGMRAGAVELAASQIRVNAISAIRPSAEDNEDWLRTRTPLGRAALVDEIADAAIYLSSPEAAIITGACLNLDGGRNVLNGVVASEIF